MSKWIVYLFLAACLASFCRVTAEDDFDCDSKSDKTVFYKGTELLCVEGQVCNKYRITGTGVPAAPPCIGESNNCFGQFTCDETKDSSVKLGVLEFLCPESLICNKQFEQDCQPCIKRPCGAPFFTCSDVDPNLVLIPNLPPMVCSSGSICNKDNEQPCSACIDVKTRKAARFIRR